MSSPSIIVLGSTNWDICMYLPHLPMPGETVGMGKMHTNLGGKGANQAVACLKAGVAPGFISCVGNDSIGGQVLELFTQLKLSTDTIKQVDDTTGTACIFIDDTGENCIGLTPGANKWLTPEVVTQYRNDIESATVLLMQLEIPPPSVVRAAQIAKESGTHVILNPAPVTRLNEEIYPLIDVITPNRGELAQLSGIATDTDAGLVKACQTLINKGVKAVVVTLGKDGAFLYTPQTLRYFQAFTVQTIDTTAAGDTFNGYLAAALADSWDFDHAIPKATAAAALSVTQKGAIPSIPEVSTVTEFMNDR